MKKRLFSLVLALLLVSTLAAPAMAYGDTGTAWYSTTVSVGLGHAGFIDSNGSLWMWGDNGYGQVSNGRTGDTTVERYSATDTYPFQMKPVKVMDNVVSLSCGADFTAAVQTDGSLWMWGSNIYNQLGITGAGNYTDNNHLCQTVPMKIMDDVVAVSCGAEHAAAIKSDGSVWTWGKNDYGQLGIGNFNTPRVPVKIMDDAIAVSCCGSQTAAVKTDHSLWTWGSIEVTHRQTVPKKVMDNVAAVSCGLNLTAAVKTDGTLWTWGAQGEGNLGNGVFEKGIVTSPIQIDTDIASVSATGGVSGAVTSNGVLKTWGANNDGEAGNGRTGTQYKIRTITNEILDMCCVMYPTAVCEDVASVSCGYGITIFLKTDGTIWVCGRNEHGELTDKSLTNGTYNSVPCQTVPVQLPGLKAKLPGKFTLAPKSSDAPSFNRFGTFTDVKDGDYFADAVLWALENNITSGTTKTTFSPNQTCSTAEALTMMWRAYGSPGPGLANENFFDNIKASAYYLQPAMWAKGNGLVSGKIFYADKPCTRADLVTYLWKLAESPSPTSKASFNDVPANASYAKAVSWAVEKGITSGTGGDNFSPAAICTRGQIVTFLHRAMA